MRRGERLRNLRQEKGFNQSKIAEMFDLTKSTICTYEKEKRNPSIEILIKYSELFGVSVDYVLGIDHLAVREDSEPFNFKAMTKEEIMFIEIMRKDKNLYDILFSDPKRGYDLLKRKI